MVERAKNLGATFSCRSALDKGTDVVVLLPARRAYVRPRGSDDGFDESARLESRVHSSHSKRDFSESRFTRMALGNAEPPEQKMAKSVALVALMTPSPPLLGTRARPPHRSSTRERSPTPN
jgi:hypothetical protein